MVLINDLVYYTTHPQELLAIIQWKIWYQPTHARDSSKASSGLKECWRFLRLSSRSFETVIRELPPELVTPVCIFYLILRSLDTIEDDMTIHPSEKEHLLRQFHTHISDPLWSYTGNSPTMLDRPLLLNFPYISREYNKLKPEHQRIIASITAQMGAGMAEIAASLDSGITTNPSYELYCHYVAGLVGTGLTSLFTAASLAPSSLHSHPTWTESTAQFLQQTNIIRDVRADHDDGRSFWPEQVWRKHVDAFEDLFLPQHRDEAVRCGQEMVLLALGRAEEALRYMALLEEGDEAVLRFVAIPQCMAFATLEACSGNREVFAGKVKISRGVACRVMMDVRAEMEGVCGVFGSYAKRIREWNERSDPCDGIEEVCRGVERTAGAIVEEMKVKRAGAQGRCNEVRRGKGRYMYYRTLGMLAMAGVITAYFARDVF
ncbi:hypothetical protein B9Z65_6557 [Elsinoe australis]|uniref:Squalene synthase n=1 Tax=Elsinoe australis TaxID=40998 RepID=A0A2P8A8Z4_9PEZI|nr:hypothetical protein B9Z65_6557 [Elsinoe australis]